jgi:hypothetical protein
LGWDKRFLHKNNHFQDLDKLAYGIGNFAKVELSTKLLQITILARLYIKDEKVAEIERLWKKL